MSRLLLGLVVVALSGCGRFGYDAVERSDDDPVDATIDAATDAPIDTAIALVCPAGLVEIATGAGVCIDRHERGTCDHVNAATACADAGLRLCTDAEWATACTSGADVKEMYADQGGSAPEWEWVADLSGASDALKRGYNACDETGVHATTGTNYDYRCCGAKIAP